MELQEHKFKVIGSRPIRHDGIDKVTGRARYGADIYLPGMLHAKVLRSPYAHARIKSIDASAALALPGVKAVVTSQDLPDLAPGARPMGEQTINPRYLSMNILAREKVLYHGHAIAAVAATTPHLAEEAIGLIKVDYELLPPVLDVRKAMQEDSPILHEGLRTSGTPEKNETPTNVANHIRFARGDLEMGFKLADVIVEREFTTSMVHQGYIEPHNAVAQYNIDGNATLWVSTQGPFVVRDLCSHFLQMDAGSIKVVPAEIGGGFGGKTTVYLEPLALLLSKKTGQPVKMIMSRSDVLRATGPTSGSYIRCKIGATKDGKMTAAQVWMAYEAGAFPGSPVVAGCMTILAPYDLENLQIDGFDVVLNKPKTCAYRAPGATNAAFASETVIDEVAEKLGIDPLEFRRINGAREGTAQPAGPKFPRIGFLETLEAARTSEHYRSPLPPSSHGKLVGRGVASGFWFNAGLQSTATVSINSDGTANVVTGSPDIGGSRTSMAMIAAEVLGLKAEHVHPSVADTATIGHTDVTGGSRVTFATGYAVYEAAQDAVRQLKERAAKLWKVQPDDVVYQDGGVVCTTNGHETMTLKELAAKLARAGGPVTGRASVNPRGVGAGFATHIVDVAIDPETGKTQILRYTAIQDVGKAIHPSYVEGQIQGGVVQGVGWAMNEEYVYDDKGLMRNAGFLDYRMPTCYDLPMIDTIMVEVPNPGHPLGIRGVGEVPIVPPPAAIANAIYRAVGVRMSELPMSPPRLLKALWKKAQTSSSGVNIEG
ncbi:MAG TPA: xanthine dehydrogenase family protein molybdopterin-binding subunit [Methylomirabilota bacterium]|nr:xanthine dehydrogenase family protein molybdopterin-binding subunit [Methylomirabilota bacterium]